MNLVGIEEITPYKDSFEFKLFKYDDKIELGNDNSFICDLKVIIERIDEIYRDKFEQSFKVIALIKNLTIEEIPIDDIKEFILDEVWIENLEKDNIDVMYKRGCLKINDLMYSCFGLIYKLKKHLYSQMINNFIYKSFASIHSELILRHSLLCC